MPYVSSWTSFGHVERRKFLRWLLETNENFMSKKEIKRVGELTFKHAFDRCCTDDQKHGRVYRHNIRESDRLILWRFTERQRKFEWLVADGLIDHSEACSQATIPSEHDINRVFSAFVTASSFGQGDSWSYLACKSWSAKVNEIFRKQTLRWKLHTLTCL